MARSPRKTTEKAPPIRRGAPAPRKQNEPDQVESVSDEMTGDPSTQHPLLVRRWEQYEKLRDVREGPDAVKKRDAKYLPFPSGFKAQSDLGVSMYAAYKQRAQFPDLFAPTVLGMVGIIHRIEAKIEGMDEGSPLYDLWEKATVDGMPLEVLHRRVTEEILTTGRVGLMADMSSDGGELPFIALYEAEKIVNWSDESDFFVLQEEYRIRTGYQWKEAKQYRVLRFDKDTGVYTVFVRKPDEVDADVDVYEPSGRGNKKFDHLPVVIAGPRDLSLDPDDPPLMGVANSCIAIYCLDADYRHQLFMSGQETLVFIGLDVAEVPQYVGSGLAIAMPENSDAKYVGPSGVGITAHKEAISDEREVAAAAGARIFDTQERGAESGDALRIRARASTATLTSVALSSAAALERILRDCAVFVGQDPEDIVVTPNLDFLDSDMTPADATSLVGTWQNGALSYETVYENLQRGGIASQERTAEEELELIIEERAALAESDLEAEAAALGIDPEELRAQRASQMAGTDEDDPDADPTEEDVPDDQLASIFSPEMMGG